MKGKGLLMTEAQFKSELSRCEGCEERPCRQGCPAGCSPADFILAASGGQDADILRAAAEIMTQNPLGGICGVVCPDRHCMAACSRKGFDRPVEIPSLQAYIIAKAKELGGLPALAAAEPSGHRVAVVGAGPAGLASSCMLTQFGHQVTLFDQEDQAGGACFAAIPPFRLPRDVVSSDLRMTLDRPHLTWKAGQAVPNPQELLAQGHEAVVVAAGLLDPIRLGVPGEHLALMGLDFLAAPHRYPLRGHVAVVGGGATACDCALTALTQGASSVEMLALEKLGEMPLTAHELTSLTEAGVEITNRVRVTALHDDKGQVRGLTTVRVDLPPGAAFQVQAIRDVPGTWCEREDFAQVIVAIGARPAMERPAVKGIFYAGDMAAGPSTVVEAVASGKNVALEVDAYLKGGDAPVVAARNRCDIRVPGYTFQPVPLDVDFFGRQILSPFLLSAAPPSDGLEQMRKAYRAGWAGGVMKTAFDNVPIHIPAAYMHAFDGSTWGNCDNVSDHPLDRVCREVEALLREFPDRLTMASTGGPVTGDDERDRKGWQSNTAKLEAAGVRGIEYSLSCPQGGDGTEGDIVSQNAALTAKIVDWIMAVGDPDVPKLFKLTPAVTSIGVIVRAIKEVLDRYPGKRAGITLANTFPVLAFRPPMRGHWEEGLLLGMSGTAVAPISNMSLAKVAAMGVVVSGNGGAMDYMSAAHFLALGARTVQFCTLVMKRGVDVVRDLHSGLSHLLQARGLASVEALIGRALPEPVTDFMALPSKKAISSSLEELCMSCGNCTRCSYGAISLNEDKHPVVDPAKCIGCSICVQKCFAGALSMRVRTVEELSSLSGELSGVAG